MKRFSSLNERGWSQFPAARASGLNDCQVAIVRILGPTCPRDDTRNTLAHRQRLACQQQDAPKRQSVPDRELTEIVVLSENNTADLYGMGRNVHIGFGKQMRRQ